MFYPEIKCVYQLHEIKTKRTRGRYKNIITCDRCIYFGTKQCKGKGESEPQERSRANEK